MVTEQLRSVCAFLVVCVQIVVVFLHLRTIFTQQTGGVRRTERREIISDKVDFCRSTFRMDVTRERKEGEERKDKMKRTNLLQQQEEKQSKEE